jgi:hypothetical protein
MEEKQYYKEKRISSSSLKYFDQSPLTFKRFLDQEIEQEEKSYLTRGKQIHMAILEPELFRSNYTHLEFDIPKSEQQKKFCDYYLLYLSIDSGNDYMDENGSLINAYKDSYKTTGKDEKILEDAKELKDKLAKYIEYLQKRKQYKDILSTTDWDRIQDLKEGCKKHKKANELLFEDELSTRQVYNELVVFWEDPLHKLPCKSMIDRLIIDDDNKKVILIDLKTANTFNEFKERCNEFKYFRQMSFYWYAINWYFINALNKDISQYTKETYIIALKTVDDPEVKVYSINERYLMDGFVEMTEALSLIAWHWENDKWDYTRAYYIGDGEDKL